MEVIRTRKPADGEAAAPETEEFADGTIAGVLRRAVCYAVEHSAGASNTDENQKKNG